MNLLSVENLEKSYGVDTLFRDVNLGIQEGDRIGVVGKNGAGKSTFVRILMGEEPPDDGRVSIRQDLRVEFLPQNPEMDASKTALEAILDDEGEVFAAVREYQAALKVLETRPEDTLAMERISQLQEEMDRLDGWTLEVDSRSVLDKLDVAADMPISAMSGGQKKRVALARALVRPADLLILDEPTNHLDIDAIEWLEGRLSHRTSALMVITHDREFLDNVARTIFEFADQTVYRYEGNYEKWLEEHAARVERFAKEEQKRQNLARRELEWLRRGPRARTTKSKARVSRALELLKGPRRVQDGDVDFSFETSRLGRSIIDAENVSIRRGGKLIIDGFTWSVPRQDRVGIIGPNGSGKTTLLDLLAGRLPPDDGAVEIGATVVLGYADQNAEGIDHTRRVFEIFEDLAHRIEFQGASLTAPQLLERFGFSRPRQQAEVSTLSGGELRRLHLVRTLMLKPNVLFLDEPTNDLDLDTLSALERFLEDFDGVVFVVSHDRRFLDMTVEHLFVLDHQGNVRDFPGNWSAWAQWRDEEQRAQEAAARKAQAKSKAAPPRKPQGPRPLSYNEKKELASLESRIAELESTISSLEEALASPQAEEVATLAASYEEAQQELSRAFERWAVLAERA